jgi:hypothetical protein
MTKCARFAWIDKNLLEQQISFNLDTQITVKGRYADVASPDRGLLSEEEEVAGKDALQ